jgi:hypothetical protein
MKNKLALSMICLMLLMSSCTANAPATLVTAQETEASAMAIKDSPSENSSISQVEISEQSALDETSLAEVPGYTIVDTGQTYCYDDQSGISCPGAGAAYSGQDAQYAGNQPAFADNGDGTVNDLNTGLMWQQDPGEKMTYTEAVAGAASFLLAGYDDWRLPTIKELYSLIDFSGQDPSGCQTESACPGLQAFIDTEIFVFRYGDTSTGERVIDSQFISSTEYVSTTVEGLTVFGVNFADGRIKGYGTGPMPGGSQDKGFFVLYVRGNPEYGINDLVNNGDGTISDEATGLRWMQDDSGSGMLWEEALNYCESLDTTGISNWRLPNAKELQSIVDYSRSPDTTNTAAIDALFNSTIITNETGAVDYGFYWSSTTHANYQAGGRAAAYVAFGRSLGYMRNSWVDVHGAGSQRSDPKIGNADDFPTGHGPQGDAIRIENQVRCVTGGVSVEMITGGEIDQASGGGLLQPGGTGQSDPDAPQGLPGGAPPQGAIDACSGSSAGVSCTMNTPQGELDGVCAIVQEQLACRPEGGPPPPPGG